DFLAHFVEHLAEIEVAFGVGEFLVLLVETCFVNVADGDDIAELAGVADVAVALAANADAGKADLLAWRVRCARGRASVRGEEVTERGGASGQEEPSIDGPAHGKTSGSCEMDWGGDNVREQRTEDRGQRTEDRGQRTEDRF